MNVCKWMVQHGLGGVVIRQKLLELQCIESHDAPHTEELCHIKNSGVVFYSISLFCKAIMPSVMQ